MVVVVMTEEIMKCQNLFWQYPAITEKTFYEQNKNNENFIGFPWATMIDKRIHPKIVIDMLRIFINPNINYYTCCQHIHFRQILPLFKILNINCVYTPQKVKGEDSIDDVFIKSCPLYAVNLEDPLRNSEFQNANLLERERPLLYSFHGAYNAKVYLTDIRKRLFEMEHPENTSVKDIGGWFYESVVYSEKQNKNGEINATEQYEESTKSYNKLLLNSQFSLCPSGSGPNSIRFWESLGSGSIPVLLSDKLELPEHELWDQAIIRVLEKDVEKIPELLEVISEEQEKKMRENCLKLYENYRTNFVNKKKEFSNTLFTSFKLDKNNHVIKYILRDWKILNPDFNVIYFSDEDIDDFFKNTEYYDIFKKMKNGVAKADFFRICYINKFGGYWFDFDLEPFKITIPTFGNVHLFDLGFENISYMFIGGKPNQILFKDVIKKVFDNITHHIGIDLNSTSKGVMEITGPVNVQNLIAEKLNKENKNGFLVGTFQPCIHLKDTDYEFVYSKIDVKTTKSKRYIMLQKQNNIKPYQHYSFI